MELDYSVRISSHLNNSCDFLVTQSYPESGDNTFCPYVAVQSTKVLMFLRCSHG